MVFEYLTDDLRLLGGGRSTPLLEKSAGETVIRAGEQGEYMYVIQSGEADIINDGVILDLVGPGGVVGEMAMVDGSLRSATVQARSDLTLLPISKPDFEILIRRHPQFGIHVMKIMSLRMRLMNARLGDAMEDISASRAMEEELRTLASRDPLTGTANRLHFGNMAAREIEQARRHERVLSVAMLDVDHFKIVNDTFGHACGDATLRQVVAATENELRIADVLGRVGGEEFAILLPETGLEPATAIAERIREVISEQNFNWDGQTFDLTVSIGVATWHADEDTIEDALTRADKNLYTAKENGRNQVVSP
jgi:diguanylate cyclase (GGDEF)-like protein